MNRKNIQKRGGTFSLKLNNKFPDIATIKAPAISLAFDITVLSLYTMVSTFQNR